MLRVSAPEIQSSGRWVVHSVKLTSETRRKSWTIFGAVPQEFAHMLSDRKDCFLSFILAFGMVNGEAADLTEIPTDELQLRNLHSAFTVLETYAPGFKFHYPKVGPIIPVGEKKAQEVGSFYTGGIDSLFTLVRHSEGRSALPGASVSRDVDYAIHMFCLNELPDFDDVEQTSSRLRQGAEGLGATFIPVVTNFFVFDEKMRQQWGAIGYGAGMASIAHLLAGGIGTALIASHVGYRPFFVDGSNPVTDGLMVGNHLDIFHDGSTYNRVEKTAAVASSPAAMTSVNVCDKYEPGIDYRNCSRCEKCLRTMVTLDILGKANPGQSPAFDWSGYRVADLASLFLRDKFEIQFAREIIEAASETRPDIAEALGKAITRSARFGLLRSAEDWARNSPVGLRYREPLKKFRSNLYGKLNLRVR